MSILPIFIPHLGCPHQCIFCNQRKISGQQSATLENAKAQIEQWLTWFKPGREQEAAFYGGSFTGLAPELQESLLELTDALLAAGTVGRVRCSTRPDYITPEGLQRLLKHGLTTVELGVQSLDDTVLQRSGRGHTAQQVKDAMALLQEYGFTTGVQLMVGLPGQSFASVQETVSQVLELKPALARIYPVLVIKDTPLAKAYTEGTYIPLTLEEAVEQSAYIYANLTAAGIQVIRTGLQPDTELCTPGNILAGPFHPSMGELVKARTLRNKLTPELSAAYSKGIREIILSCPEKLQSQVRGMHNANLHYWQTAFPGLRLQLLAGAELKLEFSERG